jgi:hypothetical protein
MSPANARTTEMTTITLNDLEAAVPVLAGTRDEEFAKSLLSQWTSRGWLSERQMPWAEKMVERAREAANPKPATTTPAVDLSPLFGLFKTAMDNGMKRPRIRANPAGKEMSLSMASPTSSNPGHLYVKVEDQYAGKITPQGEPKLARSCEDPEAVTASLVALAADPVAFAKAYGKQTGNCCFCGLLLTDQRSVDAGYGPICAEHYGLPWGDRA